MPNNDRPGVPESERDRVFESLPDRRGRSLGLSIVGQIVTAHGWERRVTGEAEGVTGVETS
jgi:signal transduction histidine kinase